jgi:DNA-directed RNA polymerase specialized sigma subunit
MTQLRQEEIEKIINQAADAAIKRYKDKEKQDTRKKRFHNTELLLRNYNSFVEHCNSKDSIDDIQEIIDERNLSIDEDELYIKSIRRSKIRTAIMIENITHFIRVLKAKMESKEQLEKFEVIKLIYFDGKTFEEVAAEVNCCEMTVRRWKNEMVRELSTLLFGVDGVKMDI